VKNNRLVYGKFMKTVKIPDLIKVRLLFLQIYKTEYVTWQTKYKSKIQCENSLSIR